MKHQWFSLLAVLLSLSVAGCIQPVAAPAPQGLQPGAKIGMMTLAKGPLPFDLTAIPPFPAFCGGNPPMKPEDTEGVPGIYTVECTVPPLPKLHIGSGWVSADETLRDADWRAQHQELYVNGQLVNEAAFGSVDADVPVQAMPGEAASKVSMVKLRVWNVVLENLTPGPLTLRHVLRFDHPVMQGKATMRPGVYDVTLKITVDANAKLPQGAPAPVKITSELTTTPAVAELEAANKAIVQRFYDEVFTQKKMAVLDEIFAPNLVIHDLDVGGELPGGGLPETLAAFPDVKATINLWVVEGDLVTAYTTYQGTQQGEFLGVAPTGKAVTWSIIDIWRVKDGKIIELWHNIPNDDILEQISPPPVK